MPCGDAICSRRVSRPLMDCGSSAPGWARLYGFPALGSLVVFFSGHEPQNVQNPDRVAGRRTGCDLRHSSRFATVVSLCSLFTLLCQACACSSPLTTFSLRITGKRVPFVVVWLVDMFLSGARCARLALLSCQRRNRTTLLFGCTRFVLVVACACSEWFSSLSPTLCCSPRRRSWSQRATTSSIRLWGARLRPVRSQSIILRTTTIPRRTAREERRGRCSPRTRNPRFAFERDC